MMSKLRQEFQSAADLFLYKEGLALGEAAEKEYIVHYGMEKMSKSIRYMQGLYSALGWARAELVSVNISEHRAVVRLHDCFECETVSGSKPQSHFMRGFVNGAFSGTFGSENHY